MKKMKKNKNYNNQITILITKLNTITFNFIIVNSKLISLHLNTQEIIFLLFKDVLNF